MWRNTLLTIWAGLFLTTAGCDSEPPDTTASLPTSVAGDGVVRGTIHFIGTTPEMKTFTSTEKCCAGDPPIVEETVVVNSNQTLRNVFVYLEGAPKINGRLQPEVTLDQARCTYVPHALGVQLNQPLKIRSSDPTPHNVHFIPALNPAKNFAMPQADTEVVTKFKASPEFIRVKCDVHPWMTAWIGVFDNPYFSKSNDVGGFEIKGIPAGTYKLVAWHELFGKQEQTVTISDHAAAIDAEFTFGKAN